MKEKEFLKECYVLDLLQCDALELWETLKINSEVFLSEFEYNKKRISVKTDKVVGLLSENDSASLLPFVQMGYADIFACNVSYKSERSSENLNLKIVIKLKKRK